MPELSAGWPALAGEAESCGCHLGIGRDSVYHGAVHV